MSFWRIFNNLIRHDDSPDEIKRATCACEWLADNGLRLRKVCSAQQIEIISVIAEFWYEQKTAPSYKILRETLERNSTVLGVVDVIAEYEAEEDLQIYELSDLGQLLTDFQEEWKRERLAGVLKIVRAINNSSWTDPTSKKVHSGASDAIKYLLEQIETGVITTNSRSLSGALNDMAGEIMTIYEKNKAERMAGRIRIMTGISAIDVHIPVKRGDCVGVLGYAGQRKSTLCRAFAYNAAQQGFNVLHVTLEQTYDEERIIYALIHSADRKFLQYDIHPTKKKFDDGTLSAEEEKFLREVVLPDLEQNLPGRLIIRQPTDGSSWSNIKMMAEMTNQTTPLDMLFVDYLTITATVSSHDSKAEMEATIKDAKQTALQFDNGRSIVFLTPIQGNRKGYEEAKATGGVWDITGINQYSEFDKSFDTIFTTFFDETFNGPPGSLMAISSVKTRRSSPLPLTNVGIDVLVGRVDNLTNSGGSLATHDELATIKEQQLRTEENAVPLD